MASYQKKVKLIHGLSVVLLSLLSGCADKVATNEFDQVCTYFDELKDALQKEDMSPVKRDLYITEKITSGIPEASEARIAWAGISYAESERYELFKTSAQEVLRRDWHCESMKTLADSLSKFDLDE